MLALDFTGHGESEVPVGGGYMPESLMADVDVVLDRQGAVHDRRAAASGAWVALLIAGARPEGVHGVVLADGSGIAGGGPQPPSPYVQVLPAGDATTPDPYALLELSRDVRPPDYALDFVRFAIEGSDARAPDRGERPEPPRLGGRGGRRDRRARPPPHRGHRPLRRPSDPLDPLWLTWSGHA